MDEILCAKNIVLTKLLIDEVVVNDWDALAIYLCKSPLVDEVTDGLYSGLAVCDVVVDDAEGVERCLVAAHKDSIVDLAEAKETQDRADFGGDTDDTTYTYDKVHLRLIRHVELVVLEGILARLLLRLHKVNVVSGMDLCRLDRVLPDQGSPLLFLCCTLGC